MKFEDIYEYCKEGITYQYRIALLGNEFEEFLESKNINQKEFDRLKFYWNGIAQQYHKGSVSHTIKEIEKQKEFIETHFSITVEDILAFLKRQKER